MYNRTVTNQILLCLTFMKFLLKNFKEQLSPYLPEDDAKELQGYLNCIYSSLNFTGVDIIEKLIDNFIKTTTKNTDMGLQLSFLKDCIVDIDHLLLPPDDPLAYTE